MQELKDYDYTIVDGVKTVTWSGLSKRIKNLIEIQNINRPKLEKHLDRLGFDIIEKTRESDGWGDGLTVDKYIVKDRRTTKYEIAHGEDTRTFYGNDDNSSIFESFKDHGGKGLFASVPDATPWYKMEKEA